MARLTGLFQRGSAYYIKVVLPKDHPLAAKYRNGRLVQSLGICTHREALQLGTLKRAEVLWGFKPSVDAKQPHPALAPSRTEQAASNEEAIAAPTATSPAPLTIRSVYARWKVSKTRSQDSEAACLRAVVLFEECLGKAVNLHDLTRAQGDQFRAWLLAKDTTSKTTRDRFTWVKSLLKYAVRDLEALPRSPWEGLEVDSKTTAKRRPWMTSELQLLFSQRLFATYDLPQNTKAGRAAAYWIPLLGLFTGARISELAQLRVQDIDASGPTPMLTITDSGDGQQVKSEAGLRTIPLHPELVRLGILDYVRTVTLAGSVSLWPDLKLREGRPGGYISAWFGEFRRSVGLTDVYPDFHCFRHTVRTLMARAGISPEVQDTITGHEVNGSTGTKVYRHIDDEELVRAMNCIRFPGLQLPRVYAE